MGENTNPEIGKYPNGNPWICHMGHPLYSDGRHAQPEMARHHIEHTAEYKAFIAWYRNEFELGYPHGLGFDLVKEAFLTGYKEGYSEAY